SAIPQKGNEVNLTLGGIDLNNSGSVVVKADKKLLTVLFPDGRDGRAFTLKAETLEDLYEWKTALENALSQAPSASHAMGQNGILRNDQADAANGSSEKSSDKVSVRATIIGTPVLLALEDVDGAPSFLEKALRFIEEHGIKVEGILRQAADVDDVERRIREYEQGKTEFSPEEDPHVIADCVKYVIRELPSSPVPASCCKALLEACRTERSGRLSAIRMAICETFPEPNRRLLQRILMMMQTVASHKAENRMSSSAVAACMAPLLLRPLLAGDCEIENDFDVGGDGSVQLLQAAAAANHAQAIVITLLEEYDSIFGEGSTLTADLYSDTEESGSESEEATDDDDYYEDDENDDGTQESEAYTEDDHENASSETGSESGESGDDDLNYHKDSDVKVNNDLNVRKTLSSSSRRTSVPRHNDVKPSENIPTEKTSSEAQLSTECSAETNTEHKLTSPPISSIQKSSTISNGPGHHVRQWGRTSAKKNLSMESIDYPIEEDEVEILRLEATKSDLQNRVVEEVKGNAILQASLERRKKALHERRLALEKDVARLQDQLERERNKRKALEAGLNMSQDMSSYPLTIDEETKAELQEIAKTEVEITKLEQKINDLGGKLDQSDENLSSMHDSCSEPQQTSDHTKLEEKQKDTEAAAVPSDFERSKSKQDAYLGAPRSDNEKQKESTPLQSKHLKNQQPNPTCNNNSRSAATPANSSAMDTSARTNTKKSGTRVEVSSFWLRIPKSVNK
ncbi:rho GTPase-activating protein REN1, partial [Carica papaya]|uniref:rho GTPase-activating protein REN1 n=1 Tax=Carica papaya TaxID=3649 RepID=UPI000B8CD246